MFATCISGYTKTVGCKQLKHGAIPSRFKLLYQTSVVHLPCEGPAPAAGHDCAAVPPPDEF